MPDDLQKKETLLKIIRQAEAADAELRKQYQIGEKFRFIRDRLHALITRTEENTAAIKEPQEELVTIASDETAVYVYLFNAQGQFLQTWLKMLNPAVFYEYSVNRPIYRDKADIDAVIRNKVNKTLHGYIAVCIKKCDVIADGNQDGLGNSLIKLREGSLHGDKLISFTHNSIEYKVEEGGQLIKIDESK